WRRRHAPRVPVQQRSLRRGDRAALAGRARDAPRRGRRRPDAHAGARPHPLRRRAGDARVVEPDRRGLSGRRAHRGPGRHLAPARARRTPAATAARRGARTATSAALARDAAAIAARLAARGVGRGDVVGLHLDRTPTLVAALLGTLRAGATYLPLDPTFPT